MSLVQITVRNLRCLAEVELSIPSGVTLLWGRNGSGKNSLLEAVFMLGRGRSFRIRNNERLIRYGQNQLRVNGKVGRSDVDSLSLGVEATRVGTTARISGRTVQSLAELSQAFAVQVIDPGVHRLIEEAGHRRRRWLDWVVFHVEPPFVETWVRYARALKQRNAALKRSGSEARLWDAELAQLGESIADSRRQVTEQLQAYWRQAVAALSGLDVELHYLRGWSQEQSLREALDASRARDEAHQLTHVGPHRADIAVRIHNRPAREVLSRGQQKLVAAAMMIAQVRLLEEATHTTPTLLLDDPAAELDGEKLERFISEVASLRCQLIVTSLHAESRLFGVPEATFRVEEGGVQPV